MEELAEKKVAARFDYRKEGICLFAEKTESGDSVIRLRWCVDRRIIDKLKELKEERPLLLLVVVKIFGGRRSQDCPKDVLRKLVPLNQEMEYIQFQGSGSHKIIATIIWGRETTKSIKMHFLQKYSADCYENSVLGYGTDDLLHSGIFLSFADIDCPEIAQCEFNCGRIGEGSLYINVSGDFFAKNPPKWLEKWVNLWFEAKPLDQCQFRRRCILAFTVQPPVILAGLILKIAIALLAGMFLLLCGAKGVRFSPMLHPFTYELEDVWSYTKGSIFFTRKRPYLAPFAPIFILLSLALTISLHTLLDTETSVLVLVALSLGLNASCALLIAFVSARFKRRPAPAKAPAKSIEVIEQEKRLKKELEENARLERKYKGFSGIACTGEPLKASLQAIPKEKRTVHLRFLDFKARLCKPFARY